MDQRGSFGVKTWTDDAVPMNTNVIQYRVFRQRGLAKSTTAPTAVVNFGTLPPALAAAFRSQSGGRARAAA